MRVEVPSGSGRWLTFPEVDRSEWFDAERAREKINPAQVELIDRLQAALSDEMPSLSDRVRGWRRARLVSNQKANGLSDGI